MSFILDSTKNKNKDTIQIPESKTTINVVDILTHRVNHLDKVTDNLDKNIDNIIDHVNTFIDNTENNHKDLMNKFMNTTATNEMKHSMLEDKMEKMKEQITALKETNDSLEENIEEFTEHLETLERRFKFSIGAIITIFVLILGAMFANTFIG